jgi:predicted dehydrogenase
MKNLRVGIIGVGRFGRLHLSVLRQIPGCEVIAVADSDGDLARRVARDFDAGRPSGSAVEMMDNEKPDAVDIVSDEASHGPLAIEALRRGMHVFVEKPLATSYAEALEIQRAARAAARVVMVGNISRFAQPYIALKRAASSGALGRLALIHAQRHFSRRWFEHFGKRVHPVYESGIHDLDLILWFASSKCVSVYSVEKNISGFSHPDVFTATLRFEDGMIAILSSAWLVPDRAPENLVETLELGGTIDATIELIGEKGTARFQLAHPGLSIWTDSGVRHPELSLWPTGHDRIGGAIRAEIEHFIGRAAQGEESPVAPLDDSVEALKLAEAIIASARKDAPIRTEKGER